MGQMYAAAQTILPERTTAEWLEFSKKANVPAIQANEIDDLLVDPQLKASGLLKRREPPTEGECIEVRQPVRFTAFDTPGRRRSIAS